MDAELDGFAADEGCEFASSCLGCHLSECAWENAAAAERARAALATLRAADAVMERSAAVSGRPETAAAAAADLGVSVRQWRRWRAAAALPGSWIPPTAAEKRAA